MNGRGVSQLPILAAALLGVEPAAAQSAMRSPLWTGVRQVVIDCRLDPDSIPTDHARFCDLATAEARRGASMPVTLLTPGAEPPQARDAVLLGLHIRREGSGAILSATLNRALITDDSQAGMRLPPVSLAARPDEAALTAALTRVLDRALPWRRARTGPPGFDRQY